MKEALKVTIETLGSLLLAAMAYAFFELPSATRGIIILSCIVVFTVIAFICGVRAKKGL